MLPKLRQLIRPHWLRRGAILLLAVVLAVLIFWHARPEPERTIQVAVAKGGRFIDMQAALEMAVGQALARDMALAGSQVGGELAGKDYGFLYAVPLAAGEAAAWEEEGCREADCAQVTFYNYDQGGTVEAIVRLDSGQVVDTWTNPGARPGASPQVVPRAMSIASQDPEVIEILGDIRLAEPAMVPMSAWLVDDDCRDDWCVDLTFMAPDGSGRIFHVFVNMEQEVVARTFYTRGRPERFFKRPAAQTSRYNDGCHEQYGWQVCWEMTAHDGIDFYDASYNNQLIFASAKIGQVEVYYPSWPGGYRDEIGYASSVPPYYGTEIIDLGNGFEVRQLYTEFLRWPNCICCYRYEQAIRFYAGGTFEPHFISHGPGCDDLSIYRPFWRIDLALDGRPVEEVWYWEGDHWQPQETEQRLSLFNNLSPNGERLYTKTGNLHYYWIPGYTDPLGLDEGWLFVLQQNEGEGDGPIEPGPADTFWPPGQWLDGERLSREEIVVWYIPILKTKQMEPFWCMPDPEPDFSPCDAGLRIQRGGELVQPSAEEIAQMVTPTPVPSPTPAASPAASPTPRPVAGEDAPEIFLNAGCGICHAVGSLGEAGKVGPDLSDIGTVAGQRVAGLAAEAYIRQSIVEPGAFIAPECPNGPCLDGIMPADFGHRLTAEQIDILVAFLVEQRGQPAAPPLPAGPTTTSTVPAVGQGSAPSAPDESGGEETSSSLLVVGIISLVVMATLVVFGLSARRRTAG
jgi:hypothetical protein